MLEVTQKPRDLKHTGCARKSVTYARKKICLILKNIESGREISPIIVTDDYLRYKEPNSPYNFFFLILIFNELFKFKNFGRMATLNDGELFSGL